MQFSLILSCRKWFEVILQLISLKHNGEMQPQYNTYTLQNIIWSKSQIDIESRPDLLSNSDIAITNDTPSKDWWVYIISGCTLPTRFTGCCGKDWRVYIISGYTLPTRFTRCCGKFFWTVIKCNLQLWPWLLDQQNSIWWDLMFVTNSWNTSTPI